jgi:hypothetical protein
MKEKALHIPEPDGFVCSPKAGGRAMLNPAV